MSGSSKTKRDENKSQESPMADRCQAHSGSLSTPQCPNNGKEYTTMPRDDAPVFWTWACSEHAADLPSWKWKRPDDWTANG